MRVPGARLVPGRGRVRTTRRAGTREVCTRVTRPSRQCASRSRRLVLRNVRPRSFGTTHLTGGTAAAAGTLAGGVAAGVESLALVTGALAGGGAGEAGGGPGRG